MRQFILSVIVVSVGLILTSSASADEDDYLTYPEFVAAVEAGTVKSVSLDHFAKITGRRVVGNVEQSFHSYGDTGTANDVLLIRLLNEKGIAVSIQEKEVSSLLTTGIIGLILFIVPVVTMFVVLRMNSKLNRVQKELNSWFHHDNDEPNESGLR